MSFVPFYTAEITLIDKLNDVVTPVPIESDATVGNLVQYRLSGKYPEPSVNKTRSGSITLRAPDGLFITKAPVLTDELAFDLFEVNVQFFQPTPGGTDPKERAGPVLRYEISKGEWSTTNTGTYVTLTLTGGEIRLEQHLDSDALRFFTPQQSFLRRITNFGFRKGSNAPLVLATTPGDIQLPDIPILKQTWKPTQPTPTKKLLNEIIKRISSPEAIGTTNEDYYYYVESSATARKQYNIFAEKFGAQDTGVILDEIPDVADTKTVQTEQSALIDNSKRHNVVILRGASGKHHLPVESSRLISDLSHAALADIWITATAYIIGDYVRHNNVRYKIIVAHTSGVFATDLAANKLENLETSLRGDPWTASIDIHKPNMANWKTPPTGYVGFVTDMNIIKPNYDRIDESNEFESVSIRDVESFETDPANIPAAELQHGRRWLVNNGSGTAWDGHNGAIAQYDESVSPAVWRFSVAPVANDVVHNLDTAEILKHDGAIWQVEWTFTTDYAKSSPFHAVKSIGNVEDHKGVLGKAIEYRFDWNAAASATDWVDFLFQLSNPLLKLFGFKVGGIVSKAISDLTTFLGKTEGEIETELGIGDVKNLNSRFLGFEIKFPLPRNASGSYAVGDLIATSNMDFENKTKTLKNSEGWNRGLDSEDLGDIRGFQFRTKVDFQNKANESINGMADMEFYACWRDIADRQIFTTAKVRFNGEWGKVTIDAGPNAKGYQIFDSRIDELISIMGFTLPQNFFIKERELTGVRFDWNHVVGFKFYYKGSYDDNHFYTGSQGFFSASITEHITQAFANLAFYTGGLIDVSEHIIDHVTIAFTDIHFLKDAYVSSEYVENADSRQKFSVLPEQEDYIDMKSITKKLKSRLMFHPQFHTVDAWGDVRARVGRRMKRRGRNILTGEIELVASGITYIEDGTGFHMLTELVNKFEDNS
jgi:hypothetical protein